MTPNRELLLRRRLLLFVVLTWLFLGESCGRREPGVGVDQQLAALVPAGTTALVGVHVDQIKTTALYARHANLLRLPGLGQEAGPDGFDPQRDLASLLLTVQKDRPLLLLRGNLSKEVLSRRLVTAGGRLSVERGRPVIEGAPAAGQAVFFPLDGVAGVGSIAGVRTWMDESAEAKTGIPAALLKRLRHLPATDQIWLVLDGPIPVSGFTNRSDVDSVLTSLSGFVSGATGGVSVDSGMHVKVDLTCVSKAGAQQVLAALRAGLAFARLSIPDNQQALRSALSTVRVLEEESVVHVSADLDQGLSDQILTTYLSAH